MSDQINMGSVKHAALTVMVDNKADLIVESSDRVKYFRKKPLLAEHGFSVLIQLEDSDQMLLWDAGVSTDALLENLRRMKIDVALIKTIALSHGHLDHYAAITNLLEEMDLLPGPKEWGPTVKEEEIEEWIEGS